MTDVTMIGLGAMGGALARAFLGAGHGVTVWNRTSSKSDSFLALGANGAPSITEAVKASPIIVFCIDKAEKAGRFMVNFLALKISWFSAHPGDVMRNREISK